MTSTVMSLFKYIDRSDEKNDIISVKAIKGTQTAEWTGKRIFCILIFKLHIIAVKPSLKDFVLSASADGLTHMIGTEKEQRVNIRKINMFIYKKLLLHYYRRS